MGRTESLLIGTSDLNETIRRLVAYADAGADCLFAPGLKDLADIEKVVAAVAPKPVNVLLLDSSMKVADLATAGVRRVSVGFSFAAGAWAGFDAAAQSVRDDGKAAAPLGSVAVTIRRTRSRKRGDDTPRRRCYLGIPRSGGILTSHECLGNRVRYILVVLFFTVGPVLGLMLLLNLRDRRQATLLERLWQLTPKISLTASPSRFVAPCCRGGAW